MSFTILHLSLFLIKARVFFIFLFSSSFYLPISNALCSIDIKLSALNNVKIELNNFLKISSFSIDPF